jgi:hypothetical protein
VTQQPDADAPAARLEVVGGGEVSAEHLAALAVALTPTGGGGEPTEERVPAWAQAALLENVGHRRPARPSDLGATSRLG